MKIGNSEISKYFKYYMFGSIVTIYSLLLGYTVYVSIYLVHFDAVYFISHAKASLTFAYMCWKFQFLIFAMGIRFYRLSMMFE